MEMTDEDRDCVRHLRSTDPRDDKKRIEENKGGLLRECYRWILDNAEYRQWLVDDESRLLWIKGNPGKGKTMLLCGIINELADSAVQGRTLCYFFCQATDSRINNATAVLRGLIYMIVDHEPALLSHVRKKYDVAGKGVFEDANAWVVLSDVLATMLRDPILGSVVLIVDAVDECLVDLSKLSAFIAQNSSISPRIKWIISSRNWPAVEQDLDRMTRKLRCCLELNEESVSAAVVTYIDLKVDYLMRWKQFDEGTRDAVRAHLLSNANGTFLWVTLVCEELAKCGRWDIRRNLTAFPPGLGALYSQMLAQLDRSSCAVACRRILAAISVVYQPITLDELPSLVDLEIFPIEPEHMDEACLWMIRLCGSFLLIRERTIFFVHQSARDFLLTRTGSDKFPARIEDLHYTIFIRALQAMITTLRRDIYDLVAPGYPAEKVVQPKPDPLAVVRYSCLYWVDHLRAGCCMDDAMRDSRALLLLQTLLSRNFLHWLEALSLLGGVAKGVYSMQRLEKLVQVTLSLAENCCITKAN